MKKTKEVKISMISAASLALSYLKKKPTADSEEVMTYIMKNLEARGYGKLAGIAAANHVIKIKERNSKATQKQILQDLSNNINPILESIEKNAPEEMSNL